jgi:hypothetical protein
MTTDPFQNFKPLNSQGSLGNKPADKKVPNRRSDNFVESVKDIGTATVKALTNDVVKGTAQSVFDQILGSSQSGQVPDKDQAPNFYEDWIKDRENQAAQEARAQERGFQTHQRQQERVVFSLADEQVRSEIQGIRQELALLVKSMGKVQAQIENAVIDNIVDPGVYHLNYFHKLKQWIVFLRQSLDDASSWLSVSSGRKGKGHYWGQVSKSGTKYSMSQERQVQMGAG